MVVGRADDVCLVVVGGGLVVVGGGVKIGLLVVVVGLLVVVLLVVGLGVTGGLVVVGLGVLDGLGGDEPPLVGVSTWLPSQYTAGPSSAMFFRMVLMPVVPAAVHETPVAAPVLSGVGYSMWKTGFPAARKEV